MRSSIRRGRILSAKPTPSIIEIYATLHRAESCLAYMMKEEGRAQEGTPKPEMTYVGNLKKRLNNKDKIWCDHCQGLRHTTETCKKLHG